MKVHEELRRLKEENSRLKSLLQIQENKLNENNNIEELINIEKLENIFSMFSKLTGFPTGFVKQDTRDVLISTGWTDICKNYHRDYESSSHICKDSNAELTKNLKKYHQVSMKECKHGMVDGATPIIIDGEHLADIFSGQVFFKKPNIEDFKLNAKEFGYDMVGYLKAVENVKIVSKDKLQDVLEFLSAVAKMVAEMGKDKKEYLKLNALLENKIKERTFDLEETKKKIEIIYKQVQDSIEYASLIQMALIPQNDVMKPFFQDSFVIWEPRDTVGGDIWLFDELRDKDECLLLWMDCTGHGIPGAFVTMIVKAIEREIVSNLKKHSDVEISSAKILGYFNRTMKTLLKQDIPDSLLNVGFDGGVIYYNKKTKVLKFTGAETNLFYIDVDEQMQIVKGDRYSVGYKRCDISYKYTEHTINVKEGMQFYLTTDGYIDQNGGNKGFCFGKRRFQNIIKNNYKKSISQQQKVFLNELEKYQDNYEKNDDITLIGFKI